MPRRVQGPDGKIHEFPDGTTDAEVADALESLSGPTPPARGFGPMQLMMDDQAKRESRRADAKANAPMIAAMVGTALAPPTAGATIPVAAGAGYLGARLRGDTRGDAAVSGAIQGGVEAGAGLAGQVLRLGAKRLYSGLVKVPERFKAKFPNVAEDLLEARRLITRGGAGKAEAALDASVGKADAMIDAAGAAGARPVGAMDIVPEFADVSRVTKNRVDVGAVKPTEFQKILERVHTIIDTTARNGGLDVRRAQELKRTAQKAAEEAYVQMQKGGKQSLGTEDLLNAAVARGLKRAIEVRVPGVKAQNELSQQLLAQLEVLNKAVGRVENHLPWGSVSDLAALGVGAATGSPAVGMASKALTFAPTGSAVAIGANEIGKRAAKAANALRIGAIVMMSGKPMRVTDLDENGLPVLTPMMRDR